LVVGLSEYFYAHVLVYKNLDITKIGHSMVTAKRKFLSVVTAKGEYLGVVTSKGKL
jgi:hypothetical protein